MSDASSEGRRVIAVCGPPAVGKSTVAEGAAVALAERGYPVRRLSSDEFDRRTYDRMFDRVTRSDDDWLLDGTFYRRRWQERVRDLGRTTLIALEASLETCLDRNRRRGSPIDERGVRTVHGRYDPPDADLRLDTERLTPEGAIARATRHAIAWW